MSNSRNGSALEKDVKALRRAPDDTTLEYHAIAFEIEGEDRWVLDASIRTG